MQTNHHLNMDVFSICPKLIPQNRNLTVYEGYIDVLGNEYYMYIRLPEEGQLTGSSINCEWKLKQLLIGYEYLIQQRLQQCNKFGDFLAELKSIIERQLSKMPALNTEPPAPKFYHQLLESIEQLGWSKLSHIEPTFDQLHLVATDKCQRPHTLRVHLHTQHPAVAPTCFTQLPMPFDFVWSAKDTLTELYRQFESCLEKYQEFWEMTDEIDSNTWVLEPERPTRSATNRRIALGNKASLHIDIDPNHPRMFPQCRFLGPDHVTTVMKMNIDKNLDHWSCAESLLQNLQSLLDIRFPSPSNSKKEDFSAECGICYAYRFDGEIADQVCDDSRCGQNFHHACLYEWLRSLASSRQSFNVVFGECPYCSKPITVKMPTR